MSSFASLVLEFGSIIIGAVKGETFGGLIFALSGGATSADALTVAASSSAASARKLTRHFIVFFSLKKFSSACARRARPSRLNPGEAVTKRTEAVPGMNAAAV